MKTLSQDQRLFDEVIALRRTNEQLVAENARLRRDLIRAKQGIAKMKLLLRRSL